jgi:CRISPR-associated protein Csx10
MKKYRLNITFISDAIPGSGEGYGPAIDTDIVFDEFGLPYIPARRFRGLLKESTGELCDMMRHSGYTPDDFQLSPGTPSTKDDVLSLDKLVDAIFGTPGSDTSAPIAFTNLTIPDYPNTAAALSHFQEAHEGIVSYNKVVQSFTYLRQSTAIDPDGTASHHSLRTARVLKKGTTFVGDILWYDDSVDPYPLLKRACQNLRRMGAKRRRGFGEVRCVLEDNASGGSPRAKGGPPLEPLNPSVTEFLQIPLVGTGDNSVFRLTYRIFTMAPIVLASGCGGETHMVSTKDFIPGSTVRGMLAAYFIRTALQENNHPGSHTNDAHRDERFAAFFLNRLNFGNAFIDSIDQHNVHSINYPLPLSIRQEKNDNLRAMDLIGHVPEEQTTTVGGYGRLNNGILHRVSVKKGLNYHHQHNPATGTVKEGLFFNYEAIESGQSFTGHITGDLDTLGKFKSFFEQEKDFHIGRSRNTQYGRIHFDFISEPAPINDTAKLKQNSNTVTMVLRSPLILFNPMGFASVDCKLLENTLKKLLSDSVKISKAFIKNDSEENYIAVWKLKRPSEASFKEGSTFLLEGLQPGDIPKLQDLQARGLGQRRTEGFGQIFFYDSYHHTIEVVKDNPMPPTHIPRTHRPDSPEFSKPNKQETRLETVLIDILTQHLYQIIIKQALSEAKKFKHLPPPKSLLARMTAILDDKLIPKDNEIKNIREFKKILEPGGDLRKTARDNLERCHNKDMTLLEHILDKTFSLQDIRKTISNDCKRLEKCLNDPHMMPSINDMFSNDNHWETELYHLYFKTFFTAMRKRNTSTEQEDKSNA